MVWHAAPFGALWHHFDLINSSAVRFACQSYHECTLYKRSESMLIYIEMRFQWKPASDGHSWEALQSIPTCQHTKKKMPVIRIAKENWMDDVECGAPSACIQFDSVHTNMVRESSHGAAPTTINWNDMESAYRKNAVIAFSCNVNFGLEKKKIRSEHAFIPHNININTVYLLKYA